ncbi:putative BTB/POZ domain-containing protein kctd15-like [Apostichopus japonicus]|uniref:Putative BTB/POZ domain-containing protein kctd15-like n=1 Tax=Stichopus japonicus TaxID=307972 RepID=A0A2G8KEH3_STIJA|nr:putative BTB/POZ domain-containing protein kctd15-like [Apostichopus japonicus]
MAQDKVVQLNVGGSLYTASQSVLTKDADSKLYDMFSGNESNIVDTNGHVFIDRDGKLFRYILNFLRGDKLVVPLKFAEFDLLLAEAEYYRLEPLRKAIQEKLIYNVHEMEFVMIPQTSRNGYYDIKATKTTVFALYKQFGERLKLNLSDRNLLSADVIPLRFPDGNTIMPDICNFLPVLGFKSDPTRHNFYRYR